jgi:predicted nucleic acid-binding protein
MPVRFVDTNVFLRFLTRDDPAKFERCRRLFEQAVAGSITLRTSELVIAEIVWTLLSYYDLPKPVVIEKVGQILNTPNLTVTNQEVLIEALVLWSRHSCDFIDTYNAALMHRDGLTELVSYDTDFDLLPFTRRQEP